MGGRERQTTATNGRGFTMFWGSDPKADILLSMTTDPPKSRRRFFRFNLRTLLIVVAVFCLFVGTVVKRARDQKSAVEAIIENGGLVAYANHLSKSNPLAPEWLRKFLGNDYFSGVAVVTFMGPTINDTNLATIKRLPDLTWLTVSGKQITDAGLVHLEGLSELVILVLGPTEIDGSGLVHIEGLTKLKSLSLGQTNVTDEGLNHLRKLTSLEKLYLGNTKITDEGLIHLQGLTNLIQLSLDATAVTDEGAQALQQYLPNCEIKR